MATYKLISSYTATGNVASITFSSIPQTYTDLVIVHSLRSTRTDGMADLVTEVNGDTSSLSRRRMYGDGSPSNTATDTGQLLGNSNKFAANIYSNCRLYFLNYTRTGNPKHFQSDGVVESIATGGEVSKSLLHTFWNSNSAITQLRIFDSTGNSFIQYSTAYLYGISNA
jgi:hypothetical protein